MNVTTWLRAEALTKRYPGGNLALKDVTVELGPGVTVLAGPNGAGKTTLLRVLAGVLTPTRGVVSWCGRPVGSDPAAYRDILGYLPQDFMPYPEMTPRAFLAYIGTLKAIPRDLVADRVREVLGLVGLEERDAARPCSTLSHGQVRRLGLAQALLSDPHLLLLDEPTSGLDPESRVEVLGLVRELAAGKIVLLSTHTLADAGQIADRVLCLDKGRLTADDDRQSFLAPAQGRVFAGILDRGEVERLRDRPGVAVVTQAPAGGGGRFKVRLVVLDGELEPALERLSPAAVGFEDAYVFRRLASEDRVPDR